jgi:hypothetical protein
MPTKLKNLVITKVALVDEGSCSAAHIKLYKRKEGGSPNMGLEEILKSLPEDQRKVIQDEIDKAKQELPEGALSAEDAKKLEEEKKQAELDKKAALDEVESMKKAKNADNEEELLKNVDPDVRAILEKAKNQAAAAEAAVKKMKDEADTAEALTKAKELPNIGAKEEDLAKALKTLKNLDSKLCDDIYGILKTANALIADGALEEIGKSASDNDEKLSKAADAAWVEIEKKAAEIKKARNCTMEQAISVAISENSDLYQKYLDNLK